MTPACHPERPYKAKGFCGTCYNRELRRAAGAKPRTGRSRATCHPDRFNTSRGLCDTCRSKQRYETDGEKRNRVRESRWRSRGIELTVERYDVMLAEQGGVCAICRRPPKTKRLAADHDHKTKKVRGLLCDWCNRRLLTPRNPAHILRAAADYLDRHAA